MFVVNLNCSSRGKCFRAKTEWTDNDNSKLIKVLLLEDLDKAYQFVITDKDVKHMKSESNERDLEACLEEAFKEGSDKYNFSIAGDHLKWQVVGELGFKVTLGMFSLQQVSHQEVIKDLLETLMSQVKDLKQDAGEKAKEVTRLNASLKEHQSKLKEFVEEKEGLERRLFEQFLPILNSKKEKIRQLMGQQPSSTRITDGRDDVDNEERVSGSHAMSDSDEDQNSSIGGSEMLEESQNILDLSDC